MSDESKRTPIETIGTGIGTLVIFVFVGLAAIVAYAVLYEVVVYGEVDELVPGLGMVAFILGFPLFLYAVGLEAEDFWAKIGRWRP